MKVLFINETCGTGSIGRIVKEIAIAIEENGGQSLIAYANGEKNFYNTYRIGYNLEHKVHAILSRISGLQGYYSKNATRKLIKKIKEFNPDIVHLNNLHGNYINLRLLLQFLAKEDIATVITLHDCWFYTGKCTHYVMSSCDKWQMECGNCPRLHLDNVNPTLFFDRTKKCFVDKKNWFLKIPRLGVVGVSKWITEEASKSFLGNKKLICVYNWVNQDIFYPRKKKIFEDSMFNILFVASYFGENKGYKEMVQLSNLIPENWKIWVVGKVKAKIPNNVIHIEKTVDAEKLAEYYSSADVCVNVTKAETFGLVTAESICCGTPVIVYNNTASPELVAEGCGYVVEEKDGIDAIFKTLKEINLNGKRKYYDACVASSSRFSKQKAIREYINVYEELSRIRIRGM